jgi:SAM-dependent methyltransferase
MTSAATAALAKVRQGLDELGWIDAGEPRYLAEQSGRFEYLLNYLQETTAPGARVLDVGSHALHFAIAARGLGFDVAGADVDYFVTHPEVRKRQARFGIPDIREYDLPNARVPFDDAGFDVVNFAESIEHLNFNPLPAITEFRRLLKPGGRLIVTTPNAVRLGARVKFLMGRNVFADLDTLCRGDAYSVHFREYTMDELCTLLEWGGFSIARRECRYLYPVSGVERALKAVVRAVAPHLGGNLIVVGQNK